MGLGLLLPAALAALAAWALPLLLHLARRSEQRPTPFAALRWLRQRPRPRQRLRLEDWPLLLARVLLLGLLALWLAQPVWRDGTLPDRVLVVAPGLDPAQLSGFDAGSERRWLVAGFPAIGDAGHPPRMADTAIPLSSLLRELDADLPGGVALTVAVPPVLAPVDAQRIVLGRPVEWRVVTQDMPASDAPVTHPPVTAALAIRHDGADPAALAILRAVALAWQQDALPSTPDITSDQSLPAAGSVLAWWHAGPLPPDVHAWVAAGGALLLPPDTEVEGAQWARRWHDVDGRALLSVARLGAGRVLRFDRPLSPTTLPDTLDGGFARRLRAAVSPPPVPMRVDAASHAPQQAALARGAPRDTGVHALQPWLALLLALVFVIERWLAAAPHRCARA
ncbi:BatA domain-containing protein [Luteimonas deserti]|uniref:BatA domain-containing protein n=1 Tax=Luteimonas deserti TaxID=2752306 RepID=A0A7Z0QRY8_9GAMM|nr:BatA domain-containing protein [Luteimonas deserti]NYZ63761.1 BatA domain-containing protein [Luteimonas deserti]